MNACRQPHTAGEEKGIDDMGEDACNPVSRQRRFMHHPDPPKDESSDAEYSQHYMHNPKVLIIQSAAPMVLNTLIVGAQRGLNLTWVREWELAAKECA